MNLRLLFVLLCLVSASMACTTLTLANLANASFTLNQGQCIYITDTNTTLQAEYYKTNDTINMTAYQVATNFITNTQYVCNYNRVGMTQTLPYNGSYYNDVNQINITCPVFPMINEDITLTAPNTYSKTQYNITVRALDKKYNVNKTLGFSECYTNLETNETLCAPEYPKVNVVETLGYGLSYINSTANISITAPPYPNINENVQLKCGESKTWSQCGVTASAPACSGVSRVMSYGEHFKDDNYKIDLTVIEKPDIQFTLKSGENYTSETYGVRGTCEASAEQFIDFCKNFSDVDLPQYWTPMNLSNYTCNNFAMLCIDEISPYCTAEEKFGGAYRLLQCNNRIAEQTYTQCKDKEDQLTICTNEKNALSQAPMAITSSTDSAVYVIVFGAVSVAVIILLCFLAIRYFQRKQAERGEGQVP